MDILQTFSRYFLLTVCLATGLFITAQGMEQQSPLTPFTPTIAQSPAGPVSSEDDQSPMRTKKLVPVQPVTLTLSKEIVEYLDYQKIIANTPYPVEALINMFRPNDLDSLVTLLHQIMLQISDLEGAPFVKMMLEINCGLLETLDANDITPLMYAAAHGKPKMLSEILHMAKTICWPYTYNLYLHHEARGYDNATALSMAQKNHHTECIFVLSQALKQARKMYLNKIQASF